MIYHDIIISYITLPVASLLFPPGVSGDSLRRSVARGFPDVDLDARDLGGNLTWDPPEELDLVDAYQAGMGGWGEHGLHGGEGHATSCYIHFSMLREGPD